MVVFIVDTEVGPDLVFRDYNKAVEYVHQIWEVVACEGRRGRCTRFDVAAYNKHPDTGGMVRTLFNVNVDIHEREVT